jgi:hypothetical protein
MAMTAAEKRVFRQGLASKKYADELIALINAGATSTLSQKQKRVLQIALASEEAATSVIAAFETGTALSADAVRSFRNMITRKSLADTIITQINAIA